MTDSHVSISRPPTGPWLHVAVLVAALFLSPGVHAATTLSEDPIAVIGHGSVLDSAGNEIDFDTDEILDAQAFYLEQLEAVVPTEQWSTFVQWRADLQLDLADAGVDDVVQQNSWLIAWMIGQYTPGNAAYIHLRNSILRDHYEEANGDTGELSSEAKALLESLGVQTVFGTTNFGAAYIQECADAGVPIPPDWGVPGWDNDGDPLDPAPGVPGWTHRGILTDAQEFISQAREAEVYTYESVAPRGGCIALPRYDLIGGVRAQIGLLGIICLGQDTSKACFWDQKDVPLDVVKPLDEFIGGVDLNPPNWDGGICSNCHAGENPWVIHPGTALTAWGSKMPLDWHQPLVHTDWPQNPGPTRLLDAPPFDARAAGCKTCHSQAGPGGRFPELSLELKLEYCPTVLRQAAERTMPGPGTAFPADHPALPGPAGGSIFADQAIALLTACNRPPSQGTGIPATAVVDDATFISPPRVVGPLYACAETVVVRGTIRHADVDVYIDGILEASFEARQPDGQMVVVRPLVEGEKVTATQNFGGLVSGLSEAVVVRDHSVDYPLGLPAPQINPDLIHECGTVIAVRHVPGATITTYTNGGNPSITISGYEWTLVVPGVVPFVLGDKYTAIQSLCDDTSPLSDAEVAVAPPAVMPTPEFFPAGMVEGQEAVNLRNLAHGAKTTVDVSGFGQVANFSTAVSYQRDIDIERVLRAPLSAGDVLSTQQVLCPSTPGPIVYTDEAEPCETISAPVIRNPTAGDEFIIVLEAVPGARIRVYDASGAEIADGSGTIIATRRAVVAGEILTAVQDVGSCTSSTAFQVMTFELVMATPEPAAVGLLMAGTLTLLLMARRRSSLAPTRHGPRRT